MSDERPYSLADFVDEVDHIRACDLVDEALAEIAVAQDPRGLIASRLRAAARKLDQAAKALSS